MVTALRTESEQVTQFHLLLLQRLKKLREDVRARPCAPCRLLPLSVCLLLCKKEESEFEIYCTLRARSWAWIYLDLLGEFWGEPGPKHSGSY